MLTPSKGAVVKAGQTVEVNYHGVDGRTGKTFDESFSRGTPIAFSLAQVVPGFSKGLVGQRQGSRVVIAMPGKDGYDASGGNPQAGIEVGDTLIFVVDLVGVQLAGPEGTAVKPKAGLPTVTEQGRRAGDHRAEDRPADHAAGAAADQGQGQEGRRERPDHLRLPLGPLERRQAAGGVLQHASRPPPRCPGCCRAW